MRIVVCTKRDLAGTLVLNELLPRLSGCRVLVLLSDKTRAAEQAVPELAELKFLERDLPVDTLFPLVDGMGGGGRLATLEGVAARFGVPVQVVEDAAGPPVQALLHDFAPDLMVSARFSHIFRRPVFEIPRLGTYNIHPGALPHYAGLFAVFRGLLDGQARIGCSLHRVDEGVDTGPVVGIGWLPVEPGRSLLWHVVNAYRPGLDLFTGMVEALRAGETVTAVPQDRAGRRYRSLPDTADFAAFRARGLRLFDPAEYGKVLAGFMPDTMVRDGAGREPCFCARA